MEHAPHVLLESVSSAQRERLWWTTSRESRGQIMLAQGGCVLGWNGWLGAQRKSREFNDQIQCNYSSLWLHYHSLLWNTVNCYSESQQACFQLIFCKLWCLFMAVYVPCTFYAASWLKHHIGSAAQRCELLLRLSIIISITEINLVTF